MLQSVLYQCSHPVTGAITSGVDVEWSCDVSGAPFGISRCRLVLYPALQRVKSGPSAGALRLLDFVRGT